MKKLIIIFLLIIISDLSYSQVINFENIPVDKKNIIQTSFGLNMAVIGDIEYSRVLKFKEKTFLISANITLPMGKDFFDDRRFAINISANSFKHKNWELPIHFGVFSTFTSNKMSVISTIGTKIAINPGFYKKSWFIASEITYDKFILSYIKNSDYYKETYFLQAKDAWYKNSGGNFHFGIMGGKTIKNSELNLRIGIITTENFNSILVPYYALIGYKFTM